MKTSTMKMTSEDKSNEKGQKGGQESITSKEAVEEAKTKIQEEKNSGVQMGMLRNTL